MSDENVQKQLQQVGDDSRISENTGQRERSNLDQYRSKMQRDIKAKDYFNSHNDDTREATDRIMKWIKEKDQKSNSEVTQETLDLSDEGIS